MAIFKFLGRWWKEVSILILLAVILMLARHIGNVEAERDLMAHHADSAWSTVKFYKDKSHQQVAQINVLELTTTDLKNLGERLGTDNVRLTKQVGNLSNLVLYYKGNASFSGKDTVHVTDTVYLDPVTKKQVEVEQGFWTNGHLYLMTHYFPDKKEFVHDYSYDLGGFELTGYRKKKNFLDRGQLVTDIRFGDPNLQVRYMQGIVIKEGPTPIYNTRGFNLGLGAVIAFLLKR